MIRIGLTEGRKNIDKKDIKEKEMRCKKSAFHEKADFRYTLKTFLF